MQGVIKGYALLHSVTWYKDEDKEAKTNPQESFSLHVLERTDNGPVAHKVKVPRELVGAAQPLDEQIVELLVDIKATNFGGKSNTEFRLLRGKPAVKAAA